METAILCYTEPVNMNLMQYTDDFYDKSCRVADVYDEPILNDIFMEGVDSSIYDSM